MKKIIHLNVPNPWIVLINGEDEKRLMAIDEHGLHQKHEIMGNFGAKSEDDVPDGNLIPAVALVKTQDLDYRNEEWSLPDEIEFEQIEINRIEWPWIKINR